MDVGIVVVEYIAVTAIRVEGEGAIEPVEGCAGGGVVASETDAGDGGLLTVAIRIRVVEEDVASGVCTRNIVADTTRFDGGCYIGDGGGRIVGTLNGDGEAGLAACACSIHHGVVERIGQGIARQTQGLHRREVVVDHVAVAAVAVEGQPAISASELATNSARCAAASSGAGPYFADGFAFSQVGRVGIGIVGEDVAAGIAARGGVVDAPRLDGCASIIDCHRCVIATLDGDSQGGGAGQSTQIRYLIVEEFGEGISGQELLHGRVVVVEHIAITAIHIESQGAILAH